MVTHGHPAPVTSSELIGAPPPALAAVADLDLEDSPLGRCRPPVRGEAFRRRRLGPQRQMVPGRLDNLQYFHAFLPNQREAMAFTGKDDPVGRPLCPRRPRSRGGGDPGAQGAMAVDSETGEEEWVPSLPVSAYDPTGAGDCFGAAFIVGSLRAGRWRNRLRFANLCASWRSRKWAVPSQRRAGATSPTGGSGPTPGRNGRAASGCGASASWRRSCATSPQAAQRRATATIAHLSDA